MLMRTLAAATAAAALMSLTGCAHAVGSSVDVHVMDRVSGETLPMYWHNGRWWVPGKPGNRYSIALTNRSGGRVLAVISVDGVNVISGETASPDQTGYVLTHGQFTQITGWRKNMSRVAAFEFTSLPNSYAARTGRPDNVGVIGVAVFREKPRYVPPPAPPVWREHGNEQPQSKRSAPEPSTSASGDAAAGSLGARSERERQDESRLGTGHGRNEHAPTRYTDFERASPTPDEVITIHYDSRENLVAMGVIPVPRTTPNPFPAAVGFVPDPPRR
jgi:hypothetical protein